MRKNRQLSRFLSSFLVFLLILALFGWISNMSSQKEGQFSAPVLCVKYMDKELKNEDSLALPVLQQFRFEVDYQASSSVADLNYFVEIVPKVDEETDFVFKIDGYQKHYSSISSLSLAFNLTADDGYFTFDIPYDLTDILAKQYPENVITNTQSALNTSIPYFTLKVYSYDKLQVINVDFHLVEPIVSGIGLNQSNIIF